MFQSRSRDRWRRRVDPAVRTDVLAALEEQRQRQAAALADRPVNSGSGARQTLPPASVRALERSGFTFDPVSQRWWPASRKQTVPPVVAPPPVVKSTPTPATVGRGRSTLSLLHRRAIGATTPRGVVRTLDSEGVEGMRLSHWTDMGGEVGATAVSHDSHVLASVTDFQLSVRCLFHDTESKSDEAAAPMWATSLPVTVKLGSPMAFGRVVALYFHTALGRSTDTTTTRYFLIVGYSGVASISGSLCTYGVTVNWCDKRVVSVCAVSRCVASPQGMWSAAPSPHINTTGKVLVAVGGAGSKSWTNSVVDVCGASSGVVYSWRSLSDVFTLTFASYSENIVLFGCRNGAVGCVDMRQAGVNWYHVGGGEEGNNKGRKSSDAVPYNNNNNTAAAASVTYMQSLWNRVCSTGVVVADTDKCMKLYDVRAWGKGDVFSYPGYHNSYKRYGVTCDGPWTHDMIVSCCPDWGKPSCACAQPLHGWDTHTGKQLSFKKLRDTLPAPTLPIRTVALCTPARGQYVALCGVGTSCAVFQ